jgi:glycosyltransferase involved in cell wall biosynthesis
LPIRQITSFADVVIVGNRFLRDQLAGQARHVVILPTCVAVRSKPMKIHGDWQPIRVGWIGTADNLPELDRLRVVFGRIRETYGDRVLLSVVSSRPYFSSAIPTESVRWALATEAGDVGRFDIGIMPLFDGLYARGKCSFKAVQCMAHGIPAVVSPVGMNTEVVCHGTNGFLASTDDDWVEYLAALVDEVNLRAQMGTAARETIERSYSYERALPTIREAIIGVSQRPSHDDERKGDRPARLARVGS